MDTVEKLKEHIEILEDHLKKEKKFRDQMNNVMKFNEGRNKTECSALRDRLCDQMRVINRLTSDLESAQDDLLALQAEHKKLIEQNLRDKE